MKTKNKINLALSTFVYRSFLFIRPPLPQPSSPSLAQPVPPGTPAGTQVLVEATKTTPDILFLSSPKGMLIDLRERGREGEREGEKYELVASCTHLDWGLNPQPRHVF